MIQFILMLLGLTFSNNKATITINKQNSYTVTAYSETEQEMNDGGPVGGNSGQLPPPGN